MAKAGDQYAFRTGNIWNYAQRDDVRTVASLVDHERLDPEMRNKVGWTALHAAANGGGGRKILADAASSVRRGLRWYGL